MGKKRTLLHLLFSCYLIFLFLVVAVKFTGSLTPLYTRIFEIQRLRSRGFTNANFELFGPVTRYYFANITSWGAFKNIFGNTLVFAPLGFFVPAIFINCRRFVPALCCCLVFILFIETFQLVSCLGYFDVDDIFLNFCGCLLGYVFYRLAATRNTERTLL